MENRYEIRGKIGQGGLGAVYRGYDTRMNREVAVKRISPVGNDLELRAESTRQLIKEAGALASLQHPHIVTIYDVGSDEDGPYVVMELITGKTLDESIERAPLTWADFRELAMQTQEALIAAQELNIIHSDLKPANLMLTWLPSGKFQVKIVDFGLASLSQTQDPKDLESIDTVFGSVFFMPPEQFERAPLDARSDIYAMGCVYYQALTGIYPFDGKTANEVMSAHLHHTVKPISEVRAGIPMWVCDWIMWQINRQPQDRPASSREALSTFFKNDRVANAPMSLGVPKPVLGPPRTRMVAPTRNIAKAATLVQTTQVATLGNEGATITQTAPQPLAPPEGFKPSVHTSLQAIPNTLPEPSEPNPHGAAANESQRNKLAAQQPKNLTKHSKQAKIVTAIIIVGLVLASASLLGSKLLKKQREANVLTQLVAQANRPGTPAVSIDGPSLRVVLESLIKPQSDTQIQGLVKVLILALARDATDIDACIAEFAIKHTELPLKTREALIGTVLRERKSPSIISTLMAFASSSKENSLVSSALQAVRPLASNDQFPAFLKLIETTDDSEIRVAAELNIEAILNKTKNVTPIAKQLEIARESTVIPEVQKTLRRLLSVAGSVEPQSQ